MRQTALFGEELKLAKLSKLGDWLEELNKAIEWERFRPILGKALNKDRKSNAGNPGYDIILMFKIIVYQRLKNLSDDKTEFDMNNCLNVMRFLNYGIGDKAPDAKTIWLFKERLAKAGILEDVFERFVQQLENGGLMNHDKTIIDSTFYDAPRQRNSREENKQIKAGEIPEKWKEQPNKLAQKDMDARWAVKGKETHYGYKNHTKIDSESKLIAAFEVTPANVHDSNVIVDLIDEKDKEIYADSAYADKKLPEHVENKVHEKGYRNHPLTEEQKHSNKEKSRTRARGEHVYGDMTNGMNGLTLRCIGIVRARFTIALANLVYNFRRYVYLLRRKSQLTA